MISWINIEDREPLPGQDILVELKECKIIHFLRIVVREGENLEHIRRWTPIEEEDAEIV